MENKEESLKYIKQSFELKNRKLYKEAIEVLYKVLTDDVDIQTQIEVISQIGDLHLLLKNYDRAIEQYEHVLDMDQAHAHSQDKLYEIFFELKEYEKAAKISEKTCANSQKPYDFVKYFAVLLKLKQTEKILQIYNSLNEELQNNPEIMYIISLLKVDEKQKILEKIVKMSPSFTDAKFDLAMIYYNLEDYKRSKQLLDEILKIKKDTLSYYYKALIQIKEKNFFMAIDNLHLAIKASKGNIPEFYFELAKTYMEINWFEEAINTIKSSITLYIKQGMDIQAIDKSYLLLAWVFEKQKDYDNALFNLSLINKNSIFFLEAEILRAVIDYKKGNIVKAKDKLEDLYKSYPQVQDNLTLIDTLGNIYKDLKLNVLACEFFEKHITNYPNSLHTVCEFVDLLINMEDYALAFEYMEKYKSCGKIASFLNSKARIYYRKKDFDKAISYLDELISCDKNNAEGYYFKGLILNQKGKYKEAFKNIKTALELNPTPAKYYAQAAYSNLNMDFYAEAMLYIKEAIEIDPNELNYKKLAAEISKKEGCIKESEFWQSIVDKTEKIIRENQRL